MKFKGWKNSRPHYYKLCYHDAVDDSCTSMVIPAFNVLNAFEVVRNCYPTEFADQVISTCFNCAIVIGGLKK